MARDKILTKKFFFIFIGLIFVILPLTPVNLEPNERPSPDFLFCFIFMSLVRSPRKVSINSILFICIIADFLWYRPIGLTTLTVIVSSEILRRYLLSKETISLLEEFVIISSIFVLMTFFQEVIKFFTLIPSMILSDQITYVTLTLLLYFFTALVIRVFRNAFL